MSTLTDRLVSRIVAARGKSRLHALLKEAKGRAADKWKWKTTGTPEELQGIVDEAVQGHFVTSAELQALTDELEEVGGQHVYLFKLTEAGRKALTAAKMKGAFTEYKGTADYYVEEPAGKAVHWLERDGNTFLKQIHTAEFWELDRKKSVWNDQVRRREWKKIRRRAVNLMIVDVAKGTAEICIDRLTGEDDPKLAEREFAAFLESLKPWLDPTAHLVPVKVSTAFRRIVLETMDEAFMNADGVYDESIKHRMSNQRRGTKGTDIRKRADYNLDGEDYIREGLRIYWFTEAPGQGTSPQANVAADEDLEDADDANDEEDDARPSVYTIISAVVRVVNKAKVEHAKVYISKKISAKDRAHVIDRIRHFAE